MRRGLLLAVVGLAVWTPVAEATPKLTLGEARRTAVKALHGIDAYAVAINRRGAVRWSRTRLVLDARYHMPSDDAEWSPWTLNDELTVTERHGRVRVSSIWFDL